MWDLIKMRRDVVAYVYGLFPEATAELTNLRDGNVVQALHHIFVEGRVVLLQPNFNAVRKAGLGSFPEPGHIALGLLALKPACQKRSPDLPSFFSSMCGRALGS
jgi:hypothetical protein